MSVDTPQREYPGATRHRPPRGQWESRRPAPVASALPLVAPPRGDARRLWRLAVAIVGGAAVTVAAVIAFAMSVANEAPRGAGGAPWDIEVSSGGAHTVTALVFGREAGVHLMKVPAANAPAVERRRVAARLGVNDVYLVSLGRDPLAIETTSPEGSTPVSFGAHARFVKLYHGARGTGVRTGWR